MEGQITIAQWQQWKQDIKDRLNQTVENFIFIGHRLRQIQETEAYQQDGFNSLNEFAKKEFNLSASTVSRFMAISARFTVEGNGQELLPEYRGMAYSKLQEMLTLSDEDCRLITAQSTVKEIKELKEFNKSDPNMTDRPAAGRTPLQECLWDFFSIPGNKVLLDEVMEAVCSPGYTPQVAEKIADTMAPSGNRTHRKGIVYLFMYDYSRGIAYKLMTSPRPVRMDWDAFLEEIKKTYADCLDGEGSVWEAAYGPLPREPEKDEIPGQMDITQLQEAGTKKDHARDHGTGQRPALPEQEEKEEIATSQQKRPENITKDAEIIQGTPVTDAAIQKGTEPHNKTDAASREAENNNAEAEPVSPAAGAAVSGGNMENRRDREPYADRNDRENIWNDACVAAEKLNLFFQNWTAEDLMQGNISSNTLETAYRNAIDAAAALEKMINGQKHPS